MLKLRMAGASYAQASDGRPWGSCFHCSGLRSEMQEGILVGEV
jgi:hypothetical protein